MSSAEASLFGIVSDSNTGDPISGLSVAIFNSSTNQKLSAKTDGSGAYSIQSDPRWDLRHRHRERGVQLQRCRGSLSAGWQYGK